MTPTETAYLVLAGILAAILLHAQDGCRQYTEGTDSYYQCTTGDEINLTIQDEVDSPTSRGRD